MFMRLARIAKEAARAYWEFPDSASDGHILPSSLDRNVALDFYQLLVLKFELRGSHHWYDCYFDREEKLHVEHE